MQSAECGSSQDSYIENWLQGIALAYAHHDNRQHTQATSTVSQRSSPPTSISSGHSRRHRQHIMDPPSPSKRPRVDEGDEMEWDPNKTPIANRIGRVTGAPSLPPPVPVFDQTSPTSSRAGSSYPSDSSKVRRSKSPVKNAASLDHLAKPVRFITLAPNAVPQLPEDAHELYTKVRDILADHEQILPIEIRPELEDITGRKLGSHWFKQGGQGGSEQQGKSGESTASGQGGSGSKQEEGINASYKEGRRQRERGREARQICLDELDKFVDIQAAADDCQLQSRHELAWNMLVHLPLLQHIFSGNARHIIEPVTSVTIAQAFVPRWSNNKAADNAVGDAVNSKKVDFVVKLNPASDILNAAIHKAVSLQPVGIDTVNQTTYASLRYHPIALTIETKTSTGSREEANIQLAIWTAAWYRRLQSLSLAPLRMITLPLLLVVEHDWRLYFAVDRGDSIDILVELAIGDTRSIEGIFTIKAVALELCRWIDGPFSSWLMEVFVRQEA